MKWCNINSLSTVLPVIITLMTLGPLSAQNSKSIEKQAIKSFNRGNFVKAKDQFVQLYESGWNINQTTSYLAQCYLELHSPQRSYDVLKELKEPDQEHVYLLILSSYFLEKFKEADGLIKQFNDTANFDIQSIERKVSLALSKYTNQAGFMVQNFGPVINSEGREYSAVMYNDYNKLLFTSRRENETNTAQDGLAFETIYYTEIDSSDNWKKPVPLEVKAEQDKSHDATVQVYQAGQKMISYQDGRLYSSSLKDGSWTKDSDLDIHGLRGSDTHCFITEDEKTIFFASDYLSEGAHLDLFVAYKNDNGKWSEPKPIEELNTEYDEDSPFLASDSTFYFSSRGHNSMGGYDIFKSTYNAKTKAWNKPENLGYPINTVAEDTYYTTDGKLAYLSSSREGGYGSLDLYRVFLFNKVKVQGILYNDDQNPIADAKIDVKYDSITLNSFTDENGYYEMFVPINKKMHITFFKDSLNHFEGDYVANIFMKDENNNEFNFFIDYLSSDEDQVVKHINIDAKNDYEDNPILASTTAIEEKSWSDSLNHTVQEQYAAKKLAKREVTIAHIKEGNRADIKSDHLTIKDAIIATTEEKVVEQSNEEAEFEQSTTLEGYTIQILAMPKRRDPDKSYFKNLNTSFDEINNSVGNDGLNRFFIGEFESKKEALKQMRMLRIKGYNDAFVRKLAKYATF